MFSPFLLPPHLSSFFGENVVLVNGVQVHGLELLWKGGRVVLEVRGHLWRPHGTQRVQSLVGGKDGQPGLGVVILKASASLQLLRPPFQSDF